MIHPIEIAEHTHCKASKEIDTGLGLVFGEKCVGMSIKLLLF
ncbi:hypothetical protein ACJZTR_00350 [Neorickettsia risticii]|nr:hypothetical protein [Neorickettsia risticii]